MKRVLAIFCGMFTSPCKRNPRSRWRRWRRRRRRRRVRCGGAARSGAGLSPSGARHVRRTQRECSTEPAAPKGCRSARRSGTAARRSPASRRWGRWLQHSGRAAGGSGGESGRRARPSAGRSIISDVPDPRRAVGAVPDEQACSRRFSTRRRHAAGRRRQPAVPP